VDGVQRSRERLARLHQVAQIGPRVTPADHAVAGRIGRTLILGVARAFDVQPPLGGEEQPMARGAGGQHAVHHVHAHARILLDLVRIADAHHVAGLVGGQQRQHLGDHLPRQLARLAHAEAPDGIAVEVHLHQPLHAFAAQIAEHSTLHDAEQTLPTSAQFLAPRNLVAMRMEMVERAPRPSHRQPQAFFRAAAISRVLSALVEGHADISAQRDLHIHRMFWGKKVTTAIQVRPEANALVAHLAQLAQAENLKAARVGQHGPRPTDEPMQPAHAPDGLVARPQVEMIGVAEDDFRAEAFEHILRHGFDRARSAHRHEDRRFDRSVRQIDLCTPPAGFGCCKDVEFKAH